MQTPNVSCKYSNALRRSVRERQIDRATRGKFSRGNVRGKLDNLALHWARDEPTRWAPPTPTPRHHSRSSKTACVTELVLQRLHPELGVEMHFAARFDTPMRQAEARATSALTTRRQPTPRRTMKQCLDATAPTTRGIRCALSRRGRRRDTSSLGEQTAAQARGDAPAQSWRCLAPASYERRDERATHAGAGAGVP